jgi:hypothetical protein
MFADAAVLAAGVTFICFLVAKALSTLIFGA